MLLAEQTDQSTSQPTSTKDSPLDLARLSGGLRLLRHRVFANVVVGRLRGSAFRVALALALSLLFWFGLFALFFEGFQFLARYGMISGPLVEMLFGLFFGSLTIMLAFSSGIILYAGTFTSREAEYLLALPIPADRVFAFKFQEAIFFSCWGFLLLGSPMMVAFGICTNTGPIFYLLGLGCFLSFAIIPCSAGALLCLSIASLAPKRKLETLAIGVIAFGLWFGYRAFRAWQSADGPTLSTTWLNSLLRQVRFGNVQFLPSQWITKSILASVTPGGLTDAGFYLLVLASNAAFAFLLTTAAYAIWYRRGYDRMHSLGGNRKNKPGDFLAAVVDWILRPFLGPVRVLIVKDIRVFARDPVQWLQVLIFCGLLAFYFANLGKVKFYATSPYWRNLIGFFNLAVMGLLLATFTSRFIFPLLSQEGRRFWILGLCPVSREAILWGKFAFSAGGTLIITLGLSIVGVVVLKLSLMMMALQLLCVVVLCVGVSGISVGLGARFPDMRQTDPSRIAAGFGGTLNLVASLAFIFAAIATLALPCHFYALTLAAGSGEGAIELAGPLSEGISYEQFQLAITVGASLCIALGCLAVFVPMGMGIKHFRAMEF